MKERGIDRASRLLLAAPLIFVCHFLEEGPGFVVWFNGHVARGISERLFWQVNLWGLFITLAVVGVVWFARSAGSLIVAATWLGFLFMANAVFHVVGGMADGGYVPGLLTAVVLYVPYYVWFLIETLKTRRVNAAALTACVALGSLPMLMHGYLIIFRGSRLF